jgi:hypothetical protein
MDRPATQPRILTLKEVLEGAERAQQRVSTWPEWKRELSASASSGDDSSRAPKSKKSAG